MYAGRVVERAPSRALFADTQMPYTRALMDSIPRLANPSHTRLQAIAGRPPDLVDAPKGCRFAPRCPYVQGEVHRRRAAPPECRVVRPRLRLLVPVGQRAPVGPPHPRPATWIALPRSRTDDRHARGPGRIGSARYRVRRRLGPGRRRCISAHAWRRRGRRRPPAGRAPGGRVRLGQQAGPRRLRHQLRHPGGRDPRAGGRVRLRQVDHGTGHRAGATCRPRDASGSTGPS